MTRMTRSQEDLLLAERLVTEASQMKEKDAYKIYGGLCHSFPVLVRTCGLCQALAFHQSKAGGNTPRELAHARLLKHVGELLQKGENPFDAVRIAPAAEYMLQTRRLLAAWIYFKRFAVSILGVESSQAAEDGDAESGTGHHG